MNFKPYLYFISQPILLLIIYDFISYNQLLLHQSSVQRMAPTEIEQNCDNEPNIDEQASLSSIKAKNNDQKMCIQLYEIKTDINFKRNIDVVSGKKLGTISIIAFVLLSVLIYYTVYSHLVTWEAKIERRIEELSLKEKSAGVINIKRVENQKIETSNVDKVNQNSRNHQYLKQPSTLLLQNFQQNDIEADFPANQHQQVNNLIEHPSQQAKILPQSSHKTNVDNSIPLLKLQQTQQKSSALITTSNTLNTNREVSLNISSFQSNGIIETSIVSNNQINTFVPTINESDLNDYPNDAQIKRQNSIYPQNTFATYQTIVPIQQSNPVILQNNPSSITLTQDFNSIVPENVHNSRVVVFGPVASQQRQQYAFIQPIILPFHPEARTVEATDFYGNDAGIPIDLILKGRQRRKLLDIGISQINDVSKEEIEHYESRYNVGKYNQLPFCVVIPTYNNAPNGRYLRNINSIIMQNYSNYHIVIIDDASTDSTGQLIKTHLSLLKFDQSKYTIKTNSVKQSAMPNLRSAAMNDCGQEQIFLVVDGDDELLGRQVFKLFNAVFQQKGLWFVYSNFLMGAGDVGFSRPFTHYTMKNNAYRSTAFVTSHLRAFYTKLFRNIADIDLRDDTGKYFRAANDVAICLPSLEQSHLKVGYLPELAYFYNADTGNNNHFLRLQEQKSNDISLRSRPAYKPLDKLF